MGSQQRRLGCRRTAVATALVVLRSGSCITDAFSNRQQQQGSVCLNTRLGLVPPPGSGYAGPDYEIDEMPDSYEPMMEYPGTMRPGRTPENMPFHDLPIGDDDPDPVPWPHFQQIEVSRKVNDDNDNNTRTDVSDIFIEWFWIVLSLEIFIVYCLTLRMHDVLFSFLHSFTVASSMGSTTSSSDTYGRVH